MGSKSKSETRKTTLKKKERDAKNSKRDLKGKKAVKTERKSVSKSGVKGSKKEVKAVLDTKNQKRSAGEAALEAKKQKRGKENEGKKNTEVEKVQKSTVEKAKARPSALAKPAGDVPATPPALRVTFKSSPVVVPSSFQTPSPTRRSDSMSYTPSALSVENLHLWKQEAAKNGLSLEEYMENVSKESFEKSLEEHMNQLILEQ